MIQKIVFARDVLSESLSNLPSPVLNLSVDTISTFLLVFCICIVYVLYCSTWEVKAAFSDPQYDIRVWYLQLHLPELYRAIEQHDCFILEIVCRRDPMIQSVPVDRCNFVPKVLYNFPDYHGTLNLWWNVETMRTSPFTPQALYSTAGPSTKTQQILPYYTH